MKVRFKEDLLVITAETPEEQETMSSWLLTKKEDVFLLKLQDSQTFRLQRLGHQLDACREPINVTSRATDPKIRLISNFAHTPFEFEGRVYESIEAFWQGLKFPEEEKRSEIARLHGQDARKAGSDAPKADVFQYAGETIRVGSRDHWKLMYLACKAKFTQHSEAKKALLSTHHRPLQHRTRKDSPAIPGVIMADIWMRIRSTLQKQEGQDII